MTGEGQSRSLVEAIEIIYLTHGCSCDEHPSNGTSAACRAWRRRAAEQVAAALLPPDKGGMALRPCPRCEALIRAEQRMCWDCALREPASVVTASQADRRPHPDVMGSSAHSVEGQGRG